MQAPLAEYRWPGHEPEAENVLPSQPQYWRKSRVQPRDFGAQTPGVLASQPCPSQTPDEQSSALKQGPPSACGAVGGAVGGVAVSGGLVGVVAGSVGVGASLIGGSDGGGVELGAERGPHAISNATISNSRIRMGASYTPHHGKQLWCAVSNHDLR